MDHIDTGIRWMEGYGREIDKATLAEARGGDGSDLIAALRPYANEDGGFGHALEPDVRLPGSSVLATTVGFQLLSMCAAPVSEPLVEGGMCYISATYEADGRAWPIVPSDVDNAPHAPWWGYNGLDGQLINPRAEIIGYMYTWPGLFDTDIRDALTAEITKTLSTADKLEMHEVLVVDRLIRSGLPDDVRSALWDPYRRLTLAAVNKDRAAWQKYQLSPLMIVKSPDHPLAADLADSIQANLDFLVEQQESDGSWAPTWSWSGQYPEDWPAAEPDIRSKVTADALSTLSRFGRTD
jgi:hypothetical protein